MEFRAERVGFKVRVSASWFRHQGSGFWVLGFGCRVSGFAFFCCFFSFFGSWVSGYMSMASLGFLALMNSSSASLNRPSSSRNMACLRWTSGSFCFMLVRDSCARRGAISQLLRKRGAWLLNFFVHTHMLTSRSPDWGAISQLLRATPLIICQLIRTRPYVSATAAHKGVRGCSPSPYKPTYNQ